MSNDIDRRAFLRRTALGAAMSLSASPVRMVLMQAPTRVFRPQPQKILVLGAGMAGLAAAFELVEQGHDVTILEARTRPGGRVLTLREPFADGLYAEAGAMQIFDTHTRAQRYIRQFGLEIDPIQS